MKICSKCKQPKPESEFGKDKHASDGLRCYCKPCAKIYWDSYHQKHAERLNKEQKERYASDPGKGRAVVRRSELKVKYGLSVEQYDSLLLKQGGGCAICGLPCPSGLRLAVDHIHGTNPPRIRGLLCCNCNRAIGLLKDRPELCEAAAYYLRTSN